MSEFKWDRFKITKYGIPFYRLADNEGHEALLHFREDESIKHFLSDVVEQVNAAIAESARLEERLEEEQKDAHRNLDVLPESAVLTGKYSIDQRVGELVTSYIRVCAQNRELVTACEAAQTAFTMWELFADCGPDDTETCYDAWEKSRIDALKSGVAAIAAAKGE